MHPYYKQMIEDPWQNLTKNNYSYKKYRNLMELKINRTEFMDEVKTYPPSKILHYTIEESLEMN